MGKLSELKQIREALNLSQTEMGALYGVKQGVYQRWESAPGGGASRDALEKAKAIYRTRMGSDWDVSPHSPAEIVLTAENFIELRATVKALREDLKHAERVQFALIGAIRQLAKAANLPHLGETLE